MCESRAVRSGQVYRQLFDAQVQLSRSLLAGRKDTRTDCLSAEDSITHCSAASSRGQQVDDEDDEDVDTVSGLPDTVAGGRPSSDIVERLTERKCEKHKEALKQMEAELTQLTQVCETQVRTVSQELLSSLQEVDLRLDALKGRMDHPEHLDGVGLQEVCGLWDQVEQEVKLKKIRITELKTKLDECESRRTDQIRAVLRKYCHLLETVGFFLPPDVHTLVHAEATMLNQALLANRRCAARLLLLLQEENLQQESLLRLHWEDRLHRWRRSRVAEVVDRFRGLCGRGDERQLISDQRTKEAQRVLSDQRCDLVSRICSLVPPTCSTALVSDWFNQLTAVNQQIDSLHADLLHQRRLRCEQVWEERLAEIERCKGALSVLQLSEEEVTDVVNSQLLPLIGRSQSQDEERLAASDVCCDSAAHRALSLSRCVFVVMRGVALLWETHNRRSKRREGEVEKNLEDMQRSQQQILQRKKAQLDELLSRLRQEGSEDALRKSLDRTVLYLQDVKHSCRQCVSDQWEVLERLPCLLLEELLFYSSSLSSFFLLKHAYTPCPEELEDLHLSSTNLGTDVKAEAQKPEDNHPIGCENDVDPAQPSQDWLAEAESSLLELCDITDYVTITSSGGVAYSGPAFRCPAPDPQQETHLSLFPVDMLTHSLSRTRTLVLDHLEQRFRDALSSAVAMVTEQKEAACSLLELQLQQLDPQHIQTHIYQPRLAELQLHRRRVDIHCGEALDVLTSCRTELQELRASVSRMNQEFAVAVSNMEDDVLAASSSQRVEAVSSALRDCLDQHVKHTQGCQTTFRQTVVMRLEEVRLRNTQLLSSSRLFSEGGDFAPQEVKMFQRRLKEETKHVRALEESICSELEGFESRSLQQVKEVSGRFEEKLSLLKSELKFKKETQKMMNSTQVQIKAEAASSNQQQSVISSWLEDMRMMMENTQVSPDQVFCLLSSVSEDLRKYCQYLDLELDPTLLRGHALSAHHKSGKQVRSTPPPGLLQPSRTGVDILDDPAVDIIRSLNRFSVIQEGSAGPTERGGRGRPAAGPSPVQRLQQRSTESVAAPRGGCRSIRTDRRFQIFGPKPEPEQRPQSFSSTVQSVLWRTNDVLLLAAQDFYRRERLGRFQLVPDTLNQWADGMQQRLLGYQEQAMRFLSRSREDLLSQLSVLEHLLHSLPSVLICHHEQRQGAGLRDEVGGVRRKMEEVLAASEQEKAAIVHGLRASLSEDELNAVIGREELRQQRLRGAVCRAHLDLQERVRVRGEEFVTSLASLTEKLLRQLDDLLPLAETETASDPRSEDAAVTMETGEEAGQKPCRGSRTWSGISYLSLPTDDTPSVTSATTASITNTRCTMGHLAVIQHRDAAVKRFEQLFRSELLRSDDDKRKHLREIQSWNTHWRQQIHNLKHTH